MSWNYLSARCFFHLQGADWMWSFQIFRESFYRKLHWSECQMSNTFVQNLFWPTSWNLLFRCICQVPWLRRWRRNWYLCSVCQNCFMAQGFRKKIEVFSEVLQRTAHWMLSMIYFKEGSRWVFRIWDFQNRIVQTNLSLPVASQMQEDPDHYLQLRYLHYSFFATNSSSSFRVEIIFRTRGPCSSSKSN